MRTSTFVILLAALLIAALPAVAGTQDPWSQERQYNHLKCLFGNCDREFLRDLPAQPNAATQAPGWCVRYVEGTPWLLLNMANCVACVRDNIERGVTNPAQAMAQYQACSQRFKHMGLNPGVAQLAPVSEWCT